MFNKIKKTIVFLGMAWKDRMRGLRDGEKRIQENQ